MPRKREATGVGRGNGLGSRKTQFKGGMPSGNPNGRPRKPKPAPSTSFADAARKLLSEEMDVQTGIRRTKRMPRFDAAIRVLMSEFGDASFKDKLAFIKMFSSVGMVAETVPFEPSEDTIMAIVEELAEEARRDQETQARFAQYDR
jgi:hypothetical protein